MSSFRVLLGILAACVGLILTLPILAVVILCMIPGFFMRAGRRLMEPRFSLWGELLEFDATFGWKPKAHLNTHHLVDDVFHVTTDAQGWRGKSRLADSELVVFGDSFAWGYGIDDRHYFADLAAPLRIKAIGTMGYNMVQALQWMKHLSAHLHGKLVVWFVYYGNDLFENLVPNMTHYRMPFVREVDGTNEWEMVTSHLGPQAWSFTPEFRQIGELYYEKLADLCAPTFFSQRAYAACDFLLRQGKLLCEISEARLAVVGIPDIVQLSSQGVERLRSLTPEPHRVDPDYPDAQLRQICHRLDVPFVALKNHLGIHDHKEHDVHWNERGHQRVADVLTRLYNECLLRPGLVVTSNGNKRA